MALTKISNSMSSSAPVSVKDYGAIGDGITDDAAAIQLALDSGASEVYFPAGDYIVGTTLVVPSNIKLYGNATINSSITDNNVFNVILKTNVVIEQLKIITSISSQISGSLCNGIYIYNSSNVWIENCEFELSVYSRGVSHFVSSNCSVSDSYFTSPALSPSTLDQPMFDAVYISDGCTKITVSNNVIHNTGSGIGVQATGSGSITNISLLGNLISEQVGYGIYVYEISPSDIRRINITGNIIDTVYGTFLNPATSSYTHGAGIYMLSVSDSVISSNTIRNVCMETNSETLTPGAIGAVDCTNASITGNYISISYKYGIFVDGTSLLVSGNEVANTVKSQIYSRESINLNISSNSLRFDPSHSFPSSNGILLTDIDGHDHVSPVIVGNQISNATVGIYLTNLYDANISSNVLRNEGVVTTDGVLTDTDGSNNIISNNRIEVNGGYGVRARQSNSVVNGNLVTGAATNQAILITGSGSTGLLQGTGTPEGAVTATVGSIFMRSDGGAATSFYIKESGTGNTGWVAK